MIFEIGTHKSGTFVSIGDGAVDDKLGFEKRGSWRAGIVGIGKFVATNCETNTVFFSSEWAIVTDEVAVGDLFIMRHFVAINEVDGVGANNGVIETLGKSSKLVAQAGGPGVAVGTIQESIDSLLFAGFVVDVIDTGSKNV